MDREKFKEMMQSDEKVHDFSIPEGANVINKCMGARSCETNLIIVIEELSELTKELTKWLRYLRGDATVTYDVFGVLEELVDVQICLWTLSAMYDEGYDALKKALNVKLMRLSERLDKLEEERKENNAL